jgi:serine/threonine protein kinase
VSEELLRRGAKLEHYEIRELIGQGGMGEVYRAWDTVLQRDVAVKVLRVRDEEMVQRFEREAEAIGKLDSENVVEIHDFRLHGEHPFIVMPFLRGMSLRERLAKHGAMSVEQAVGVALGVCRGVAACHRAKIVHRDLKPANVFLTETAHYGVVVKVLDFGVAKPRHYAVDVTGPGKIAGTPAYIAPELLRGAEADELSDQYGIGLLLYVTLSGKPPFGKKEKADLVRAILKSEFLPLKEVRPDVPEALEAVMRRALNADRAARFPSVTALGRALVPFASEQEKESLDGLEDEDAPGEAVTVRTAVEKAKLRMDATATVVATAERIADLVKRTADLSDTIVDRERPAPAAVAPNVVVPVGPMEEGHRRVQSAIPHASSSTKMDSRVVSRERTPTCTNLAGVIETTKKRPQRARGRSKRLEVLLLVAIASLVVVGLVIVLTARRGPIRIEVEPPDRRSLAASDEEIERKTGSRDGGMTDTALPESAGIRPRTRLLAPLGFTPKARMPENKAANRDGGIASDAQTGTAAVVEPLPQAQPTQPNVIKLERVGEGRSHRPVRHVRRLGQVDDRSKAHAQGKRGLEYTKDGSPILW